jgi:sterol desaturase/sphingolipid hydroxylase (fatty acid hydroxylase superfamily)
MLESLNFESQVRLSAFSIIFVVLVVLELLAPRRRDSGRMLRWPGNLGIFVVNSVMMTVVPLSAVAAALVSIEYKFGLFFWFEVAFWPKVIASLILLDLIIYWQHRVFHLFPALWRVHRMHHTDTDFDVTTALRFHPVEILLSVLIKGFFIIFLGAPVFAVIAFEIILNGSAMFNHSNIRIPLWLDRIIRAIVVTPDMHRIHHSVDNSEYNRNFGFALSLWDRLFASYAEQPAESHETMPIGLDIFNQPIEARLDRLVTQPFRKTSNPDN